MLEEYDFSEGVMGKYAARFAEGAKVMVFDPGVAEGSRIQSESITHMTGEQFLDAIQSQAARGSVGASTVRGRGNAGTADAARTFLRTIDLTTFGPGSAAFAAALDHSTDNLRAALPRAVRHWGIARKVLNIFLRNCLYTTYLNAQFGFDRREDSFELPLDSITALNLKRAAGRGTLPPWPGVKHLSPSLSAQFQEAAAKEAAKRGISRVHLDAVWWSVSRDDDAA
ncbi:MAG: hypothetical protein QOH42_95 [Blastocatellia bacterium]|nr:hypothetical protein [Blastocatellia bacterium]